MLVCAAQNEQVGSNHHVKTALHRRLLLQVDLTFLLGQDTPYVLVTFRQA